MAAADALEEKRIEMSFIGTTKQRRRGFGLRRQIHSNKPSVDNRDDDDNAISEKRTILDRRRPIRNGLFKKLNIQQSGSVCSITLPLAVDEEEGTVENSTNTSNPEANNSPQEADREQQQQQLKKSVTFGTIEFIEVPCWKGDQELWWSSSEIEQSRHSQDLKSNESSSRSYLNAYQAAYKQLTNGGDKELRLPPGLKKGLDRGHAGMECFSSLEEQRRRRARQIVRTVVAFSSFLRDPEDLREHAMRLNAPSLQWARTMGDAQSEANRYAMSVGLLHRQEAHPSTLNSTK